MTRGRLAAAVLVGSVVYAGAVYLVATADLGQPRVLIAVVTVAGLIFTVAGTVAALQRPDNRTGAQMLAVGLLWSLGALQLSQTPLVFTVGYVLSGIAFVAFAHLILSYPTGRLQPGDEWIVWAVLVIVTIGPLTITLVDPTPIAGCDGCPESAFLIADRPGLARLAALALGISAAALVTLVFIRLVRRFRAASPPLRRVIGPVYFFTLVALPGFVVSNALWTFEETLGFAVELAALAALALMPVAFLAGILRTRLQRAGIADLVIALGNGRPLRDALADALGDPSLGLAYWSSQRQAWVDEEGRTMTEPIARGAHAATFVENDGKRVAALLHDRSLADQRPLVDAVAATAGLAFEKERLQAELRAQYRFLETIIDTAPSLLSVVDTEGRIRNFNHAVEIASGLQGRALVEGRFFWEVFIDPAEREAMIQRFRDASPAFPASAYENVFTNALGEERVIAWQTAPLVDQNGDVVRIVAGGIDITDRKHR
ncbi:MAG TPA: PAS domain S-box protein, partial [Gaiellaceae bacterium]|nr:PAS domain S-box protein [Gaiellaceae bacterium]